MTEEDARLALLQTELTEVQSTIRSLDSIMVQVKGWCITVSLAIVGFAVGQRRPALLAVGVAAVVGFYIVTCQTKVVQRFFLTKNEELNNAVKNWGIKKVLAGQVEGLDITGTAVLRHEKPSDRYLKMMVDNFSEFWDAAKHPDTWPFYLFIVACYGVATIVLLT